MPYIELQLYAKEYRRHMVYDYETLVELGLDNISCQFYEFPIYFFALTDYRNFLKKIYNLLCVEEVVS